MAIPTHWPRTFTVLGTGSIYLLLSLGIPFSNFENRLQKLETMLSGVSSPISAAIFFIFLFLLYISGEIYITAGSQFRNHFFKSEQFDETFAITAHLQNPLLLEEYRTVLRRIDMSDGLFGIGLFILIVHFNRLCSYSIIENLLLFFVVIQAIAQPFFASNLNREFDKKLILTETLSKSNINQKK